MKIVFGQKVVTLSNISAEKNYKIFYLNLQKILVRDVGLTRIYIIKPKTVRSGESTIVVASQYDNHRTRPSSYEHGLPKHESPFAVNII